MFMKRILFAIILSLSFCGLADAQNKEMMSNFQNELNELFDLVFTAPTDNERYNANEQLMVLMEEALLQPKSFNWEWKLPKMVSVLTSKDNKFRVFTWAVLRDDGEFECFGYMQVLNENADLYEISVLKDMSDEIFNPDETALTDNNWFGCIYTDLITTKHEGKYFYTLLGWNGGNAIMQYRVIEPVYFKKNSTHPSFGQMIFRNGKDGNRNLRRIILRYSKDVNVNLRYDDQFVITKERIKVKQDGRMVNQELERETPERMIVFDKVGPRVQGMEGLYQYYVPTGEECGYLFEKGRWVLMPNVHCKLEKNKKLDVIINNNDPSVYQKKDPGYIVK